MNLKEIKPPSGILIEKIQNRYIANRHKIGPPTESTSEPVLAPLKKKGVILGLKESWQISKTICKDGWQIQGKLEDLENSNLSETGLTVLTLVFLSVASLEFALITIGFIGNSYVRPDGHWDPFKFFNISLTEKEDTLSPAVLTVQNEEDLNFPKE